MVHSAWTSAQIAAATGCPESSIAQSWPIILDALDARGISDRPVQIAALATIAIETASTFEPVREAYWLSESARRSYLTSMYEGRTDLGNTQAGDGFRFSGRGFVQITGRSNYTTYGQKIGVDLIGYPDNALDPAIAAKILAVYFTDHMIRWERPPAPLTNVAELARVGDWRGARVAVNGGENGLQRLREIVAALEGIPMAVTFDASTPPIAQDDPWSCAPTALRWALTALGRAPGPTYIEDLMLRDGIVSREAGLLDASGAALAAWIGREGDEYYGINGFYGNSEPSVTFNGAAREGDHAYPILIGGRAWNHWAGVRGFDEAAGVLLLANPAPGWMDIAQTMNPQQFAALGPFSMVRVLHPDLPGVGPKPTIPPFDPKMEEARRRFAAVIEELKAIETLLA